MLEDDTLIDRISTGVLDALAVPALVVVCDYTKTSVGVAALNASARHLFLLGETVSGVPSLDKIAPALVDLLLRNKQAKSLEHGGILLPVGDTAVDYRAHAVKLLPCTDSNTQWLCTFTRSIESADVIRPPRPLGHDHLVEEDSAPLWERLHLGTDAIIVSTIPSSSVHSSTVLYASREFCAMTAFSPQDLIGKPLSAFNVNLGDGDEFNRMLVEAASGASVRFGITLLHKQNSSEYVECESSHVFGADGTPALLIHVLRRSKGSSSNLVGASSRLRELKAVVASGLDGYALVNEHGELLEASSSGLLGLGWTREELLNCSCLDLVHPDDQEFVINVFRDIRSAPGAARRIDMRVNKANGSATWLAVVMTNLLHEPDVRAVVLNYNDVSTRKFTEFALQRSEERHRLLFERNPGAMWLCHPETLRFVQVNSAAERAYGYSSAEFVNMTITDILPLTSRQLFHEKCAEADVDLPTSLGVWSLIGGDGSIVDSQLYASRLIEETSDLMLIMAIDVTQQTRAHRDLLNSNLKVQLLLEEEQERSEILHALAEAAILINTCKSTQDILQRATDYARRLARAGVATISLSKSENDQEQVNTISTDLSANAAAQAIDTAIEVQVNGAIAPESAESGPNADHLTTRQHQNENSWQTGVPTKLTVPLRDSAGLIVGYLTVIREESSSYSADDENVLVQLAQMVSGTLDNRTLVEQLTENTERLRKSEERYALALEGSNDGIWDWQVNSESVIRSPRFLSLIGFDTNEDIEQLGSWNMRIHPDDREKVIKARHDHLYHGVPYDIEMRVLTFSGEYRWFRSKGQAVWDEHGTPVRMVGSFTDLTERKALEEQLLQAQKLESIGRLAGGIAHDFNNMLTGILGFSELARLKLDDGSNDIHDDLQQIEGAALRAADLTSQLLAFARKQIIRPQTTDLNELARSTHSMLTRLIGENVQLQEDLQADLWMVSIDPGQFQQVIVNLAVNARDAMPSGGKLLIETANVVLDNEYAALHGGLQAGEYVLLAVTDTGTGMDEATKSLIFEPFFTTKERGKGTGLGLSTVYGVISQNQGHVHVYSEPGRGTTFKCYFRRAYDDTVVYEAPIQPVGITHGTEHVLLVEDDELVRHFAQAALVSGGYSVLPVSCGTDALAAVASQTRPFDLVVTDVVLPGMGGADLVNRLTELLPGIRVLFVSGYTENAVVHQGILSPGTSFLSKPFTVSSLLKKVRTLLDAM